MDAGTLVFTPTRDFFSEAFDSQYCRGLRYTAQSDNARLLAAVAQWVQDGTVTLLPASDGAHPAQMGGAGIIGS
jgi:hypothetical protein